MVDSQELSGTIKGSKEDEEALTEGERKEGQKKGREEATLGLKPWLRSRMGCSAKCLRLGAQGLLGLRAKGSEATG